MDADDVDVDALPIHLAEPAVHRRLVDRHRAGAQIGHRLVGLREIFDERPRLVDEDVRVHVDGPHALSADDDLASRAGGSRGRSLRAESARAKEKTTAGGDGGLEKASAAE